MASGTSTASYAEEGLEGRVREVLGPDSDPSFIVLEVSDEVCLRVPGMCVKLVARYMWPNYGFEIT